MKQVYLISASDWHGALETAKNMGLKISEYEFIPHIPQSRRLLRLKRHQNVNKKYLVGYYNKKEYKNLTGSDRE